jgi:hypothetical protein
MTKCNKINVKLFNELCTEQALPLGSEAVLCRKSIIVRHRYYSLPSPDNQIFYILYCHHDKRV